MFIQVPQCSYPQSSKKGNSVQVLAKLAIVCIVMNVKTIHTIRTGISIEILY